MYYVIVYDALNSTAFFQSLLIIARSTEKGRLCPKKKTKIHLNRARGTKLLLEKEPIKNRQQK